MKNCLRFLGTFSLALSAAALQAGEIVPTLDDATAIGDYTAAGANASVANNTTGEITLAARFNPDVSQATGGPVIVIEDGGTSNGTGLYIADGQVVLAAKAKNAAGAVPDNMEDHDYTDGCAVFVLGPVNFGSENVVYASFNINNGKVYSCVNDMVKSFSFTGITGAENIDGNLTVSFLGSGDIALEPGGAGSLGGLLDYGLATTEFASLSAANATNMVLTSGYTNQRGQIFSVAAIPPQLPTEPSPADGAENIDPEAVTQLSFTPGKDPANLENSNPDITGYYITVYDTADGEPNYAAPLLLDTMVAAGSVPVTVDYTPSLDQTVCWQVEEKVSNFAKGDPNNILGPIWTFTTLPAVAQINAVSPAYMSVDPGSSAIVAVADAIAVDTYQWYKTGSPDIMLEDGDDYDGVTTDTLTIKDFAAGDEGYYYCIGANDAPSSSSNQETGPGRVMLKAMTSYYPMETLTAGVTPDTVGGYDATMMVAETGTGYPVLAAGAPELDPDLYGLSFDNSNSTDNAHYYQYALAGAGAMDYDDFTVTAWVYWNGGSNWQRIIDFGNDTTQYVMICPANGTTGNARFAIGDNGEQNITADIPLPTGQWVFVTASLVGDDAALYFDGEEVASGTITHTPMDFTPALCYIGKSHWPDPYFNGVIDDMKIYNYGMDDVQVASAYIEDVPNAEVCIQSKKPSALFDMNDDCSVDVLDFQDMVFHWLDCGVYPDCLQNPN